jgi:hypothetical protein
VKLVRTNSLSDTLDNINQAFFYQRPLTKSDREEAAKWLAGRRGKAGSYAGMFAPTEQDFTRNARLFTGEKVSSRAAIGHILGEEACRALILLKPSDAQSRNALKRATDGMLKRIDEYGPKNRGFYCCGICSASLLRHLAVSGLDHSEKRLLNGIKILKSYRKGNGEWGRFPFYYTLLALSETELKPALLEMRYAASVCERYLKRVKGSNKYAIRRFDLCERVLSKC